MNNAANSEASSRWFCGSSCLLDNWFSVSITQLEQGLHPMIAGCQEYVRKWFCHNCVRCWIYCKRTKNVSVIAWSSDLCSSSSSASELLSDPLSDWRRISIKELISSWVGILDHVSGYVSWHLTRDHTVTLDYHSDPVSSSQAMLPPY